MWVFVMFVFNILFAIMTHFYATMVINPINFWSRQWLTNQDKRWWAVMMAPGIFLWSGILVKMTAAMLPQIWLFAPLHLMARGYTWAFTPLMPWMHVPWIFILSHASVLLLSPIYVSCVWLNHLILSPPGSVGRNAPSFLTTHGTARFGTAADKRQAKKHDDNGAKTSAELWMGRLMTRRKPYYGLTGHVLTCAPTGAGKGIGCVLPNLLQYPGSIFCLDVKGENYEATAAARRLMGQQVHLFDPFSTTGEPGVAINWLDSLRTDDEDCISTAASLAESLVVRNPQTEPHWDDAAVNLLQGLLLYAAQETEAHIGQVRDWLTQPEEKLLALLGTIGDAKHIAFAVPSRAAHSFLSKADKERSGVLSTALRHTSFLDDPRVTRALGADDKRQSIVLSTLKSASTSLYLVIPPDKMATYHRLARVTVALGLQAMVRTSGKPAHPVLFLLDEFAQLGYFPAAEEAIAILRGYHACLWLLVQDLGQLKALYPKWRSFLANAHLQVFGTQDLETAQYVSQLLGQQTVRVSNESQSQNGTRRQNSQSSGQGHSEVGRPLKTPDEVRGLGAQKVLLFERGKKPFLLHRLDVRQGDGLPDTDHTGWAFVKTRLSAAFAASQKRFSAAREKRS